MKRTKLTAYECAKATDVLFESTDREEMKKMYLSALETAEKVAPGITELSVREFIHILVDSIDEIYEQEKES